jgi:formate dehydrogenase maturation protein FdhE
MTFLATGKTNYQARIQRAELLTSRYPFAAEILRFYRHIANFQREFAEELPNRWGKRPVAPAEGNLRAPLNLSVVLEPFRDFMLVVESRGPTPLVTEARHLREKGATGWAEVLAEFWTTGLLDLPKPSSNGASADHKTLQTFLARAFLQPYAEFIVSAMLPPVLPMTVCRCPRCNSFPLLGILRPEGEGGKRYLQCSFCSQEWEFRRIFCAQCGEEEERKLAVFTAEQFPHIRVETCETCRYFLRTVDLTKDGKAVPLVDDISAIPLTLWAHESGYKRIQENLLGS